MLPQIEHIVVLMMENHSYDNKLGMLRRPGADGFRIGPGGQPTAVNPYPNTSSEENPQNIAVGEAFAAKVINAVMDGPKWESTLLVWTYDEHGGYYDHVPPPPAVPPDGIPPDVPAGQGSAYDGFGRYGFRVHSSALACNVDGPGTIPPPGSVTQGRTRH